MNENENAWIGNAFEGLEDPRQAMNQRHKFVDVLVIAICAAICGADDWESVATFGRAKEE